MPHASDVTRFYDDPADDNHLIFADWPSSVLRQATRSSRATTPCPTSLSEAELLLAVNNMRATTRRGGLLLASKRDYDQILLRSVFSEVQWLIPEDSGYYQALVSTVEAPQR